LIGRFPENNFLSTSPRSYFQFRILLFQQLLSSLLLLLLLLPPWVWKKHQLNFLFLG
jgi:hypothetical protein